ncbi:hypothetical protein VN12_20805 [Pirellula sp. SH-Sr6A]|uniref:hypothetical protein n=1 Tax=Pirellula sp. SH-Sr6A TaxID=1632865 RepID=UPI00078E3D32|nr:hypothetical protein [Pirellula sp. SH-Sr6A]AMV33744.1 hypothetical protein VN12_16565 [Pirellula sp. SH-Sr6A]AMV34577.1 hypothetical protein VN12_20805 [Pirellula sp. SH-Sr6A]
MAHVIVLASLGGTDFTIIPNQLLECTDEEAERLVDSGQARRLLKSEPTELQLETVFRLPVTVAIEEPGSERTDESDLETESSEDGGDSNSDDEVNSKLESETQPSQPSNGRRRRN